MDFESYYAEVQSRLKAAGRPAPDREEAEADYNDGLTAEESAWLFDRDFLTAY